MAAVLKITDGSTTVNLLGGPLYLSNWRPALPGYKSNGTYLDSPLSDGRVIAHRVFDNAVERFDLKMRAASDDDAAFHISQLFFLLEKAANHHITLGEVGPVWIERKAHKETGTTYAIIVSGSLPSIENPFSQPFMQPDCSAVMDNLVLAIEHLEWRGSKPGYLNNIKITEVVPVYNFLQDPSFERSLGNVYQNIWTDYNTPTSVAVVNTRAYDGVNSLKIIGTSGLYKGTYVDVNAVAGSVKTIEAKCYVESGSGALIVYDGGGFTNAVISSTGSRQQEIVTNGDFETNLTGWTASVGTIARVAGGYGGSSWGMEVTPNASDNASVSNQYETNPAGTSAIEISYAIRRTSAGESASTLVYSTAEWRNASGQTFGTFHPFGEIQFYDTSFLIDTPVLNQWYFHKFTAYVPNQATWGWLSWLSSPTQDWSFGTYSTVSFTFADTSATYEIDKVSIKAGAPEVGEVNEWQDLSVTKTVPVGGSVRIALATDTSIGGTVYFDDILFEREYVENGTEYDQAFVSGLGLDYNLSEVFIDDNGVFSSNLLDADLPYELLPTTPVGTEDKIYFGSNLGPFATLAFDLSAELDADASSIVWKYYNGTIWDTLDYRDQTDGLRNSGRNVVSWYVPSNWVQTTVNSLSRFWVMADLTSITNPRAIPVQTTSHVHVVNKPYFQVSSDNLGGDLPSSVKYTIFNESGPAKGSAYIQVSAGADDVTTDDNLQTIATTGAQWRLEEETSVGIRFQNVGIPQGSTITKALLWVQANTSSDTTSNGQILLYRIEGEDADNSSAFSSWADFDGRTRTSANTIGAAGLGEWNNPGGGAGWPGDGTGAWTPNIVPIIQEIVDRSGWVSGNALTLFITDEIVPTGEWIEGDMYETDAGAWRLEVEWTPSARYTSAVYLGSRKVSRGSDFRGFINFSYEQPAGITVSPGQATSWITTPGLSGAVVPYSSTLMHYGNPSLPNLPSGPGTGGGQLGVTGFADAAIVKITRPLTSTYQGRYRAFCRVVKINPSTYGNTELRMRVAVGSGGSVYTNTVSLAQSSEPALIDLGQVIIPQGSSTDVITLAIQVRTLYEIAKTYFLDMILLPIDEWFLEVELPSGSSIALDDDSYLEIDGTTSFSTTAAIKDKLTNDVRANMIVSGISALLDPNETHRIWMIPVSDRSTSVGLGSNAIENASYSDVAHSISVGAVQRYIGMRGSN